ncbi:hypothetical protein DSM112329_00576 [Paraconexibacter sp. AEG42_29]|uniref:Glycoside hydrolase family 5 domain-containing protein n=1 Tax=Paraconexibacter sp. AEG42_29 TaxID=2997339 RepID=A0AAU7AQ31_9ACTN
MSKSLLSLLIVAVAAIGLYAAPAQASRNQLVMFEAPAELKDPATRDAAFARLDALGVNSLRVVMYWRDVSPGPNDRNQPDFDTTDPAAGYNWTQFDPIFEAAEQRKWPVLLTVSGPVPKWATRSRNDNLTRPDPNKFAQFMTAVGRKYGDRVAYWSIWNEPNHPAFLKPQYVNKKPVSPDLYRDLFDGALKGLKSAKVDKPQVLFGETAPTGTSKDVAPLTFLRQALCLSESYKKLSSKCAKLPIAGYAHHAYTPKAGPNFKATGPNNVFIGVLDRLTTALDRAARAGAISPNRPVFLTEFGIQSEPDKIQGVPLQQQAEYRSISERIAYDNKRVKTFSQYLLKDDQPRQPPASMYGGFETGLMTAAGKEKPSYDGFRLALAATRRSSRSASVWGLVRPARAAGSATLEYRNGASGAFKKLRTVSYNRLGFFRVTATYSKGRQYRLTWTNADGKVLRGSPTRAYDF